MSTYVHSACMCNTIQCMYIEILISLLTEPPSPVHRDSEATPLLPNSRNRDYEAILLLPNPNRSNVEAVTGECQTPSLSSSTATDSTARYTETSYRYQSWY